MVCVVWSTALSLTSATMVLCTVGCRLSILNTEVSINVWMCSHKSWEGCENVFMCSRQLTLQLWRVWDRSKGEYIYVQSLPNDQWFKKAIHTIMLKWWGDEMAGLIAILKRKKRDKKPFHKAKELYYSFWHCAYKNQSLSRFFFFFFPHAFSHPHTHAGGNSAWHT